MYRLLLVDDEEIERTGMAELIPWNDYGMELVGTARDGKEGLALIERLKPDVVVTDVKMPMMDGIEMIHKAKEINQNVSYVVLSGYGEYEYTSRAMEEGVKHYILKPSDEVKIAKVICGVKEELDSSRKKMNEENAYKRTMHRLLPKAKEQIFRNMLIDQENVAEEYGDFLEELESSVQNYYMMAFRTDGGFDGIGRFSLNNIFQELMGEDNVVLSTTIRDYVIFLLKEETRNIVKEMYDKAREVYKEIFTMQLEAAISKSGKIETAVEMYKSVQELFRMGEAENIRGLLSDDMFQETEDRLNNIIAYNKLLDSTDYEQILFEMFVAFQKMDLLEYTLSQKKKMCGVMLKLLFDYKTEESETMTSWGYLEELVNVIAKLKKFPEDEEENRKRLILCAIYQNIQNPELNTQYLAKEVFFMNVDYFGRTFTKLFSVKFTDYLVTTRIHIAQRLMQYNIKMKTSDIAGMVGYDLDGQYFSKAFRKVVGMAPSEYRESLKV